MVMWEAGSCWELELKRGAPLFNLGVLGVALVCTLVLRVPSERAL